MTYEHEVTTHRPACSWSNVSAGQRGTGEKGLLFPKEVFTLVHWLVGWFERTFTKLGWMMDLCPEQTPLTFDVSQIKGKTEEFILTFQVFQHFLLISQGITHEPWGKILGVLRWLAIYERVQLEVEPTFDDLKSLLRSYCMFGIKSTGLSSLILELAWLNEVDYLALAEVYALPSTILVLMFQSP